MPLNNVSAVIITRNVASTIRDTLESLRRFDEVVIYDNGSDDGTQDIVQEYPNVSFHSGEFLGFGKTKAHAVSLARNEWVFSIDGDETLSDELLRALNELALDDPTTAYLVLRHNYFMGKHVSHGGWGNDWLLRFFNRNHHGFNDAAVHEQVVSGSGGKTKRLAGPLIHDAVQDIGQFLIKINRYSEFYRHENRKTYPLAIIVVKSWFSFFRSYILQMGILEGWRGLVIARSDANGTFFKYMKPLVDIKVANEKRPR